MYQWEKEANEFALKVELFDKIIKEARYLCLILDSLQKVGLQNEAARIKKDFPTLIQIANEKTQYEIVLDSILNTNQPT